MRELIHVRHKQADSVIDDDKYLYKELGQFGLIDYVYSYTKK